MQRKVKTIEIERSLHSQFLISLLFLPVEGGDQDFCKHLESHDRHETMSET